MACSYDPIAAMWWSTIRFRLHPPCHVRSAPDLLWATILWGAKHQRSECEL